MKCVRAPNPRKPRLSDDLPQIQLDCKRSAALVCLVLHREITSNSGAPLVVATDRAISWWSGSPRADARWQEAIGDPVRRLVRRWVS